MSEQIGDGGPAFPIASERGPDGFGLREGWAGMTLCDYFAGLAMQAMIMSDHASDYTFPSCAKDAYKQAAAMISERSKR